MILEIASGVVIGGVVLMIILTNWTFAWKMIQTCFWIGFIFLLSGVFAAVITGGIIWNAKMVAFILFFFMLCFVIRWIMTSANE